MLRVLFIIALTLGNWAYASDENCNSILQTEPIARTAQPIYLIELESAGQIYGPSDRIPPLKTGFYIFLINSAGEILLAPKYDLQSYIQTGKGLATHKSLLNMYEEKKGTSTAHQIVGGGEFQIAFGPVVDFSNRAGNFKSDPERMQMAANYLKSRGLPITTETKLRAIDPLKPEDRGHTPEDRNFDEFHLDVMTKVEKSKSGRAFRDLYEQFHALILESFPGVHANDSIAKMLRFRNQGQDVTRETRGITAFYYPILTAYSRDGIDFGILESTKNDSRFSEGVQLQIKNVLLGADKVLSETNKAKWRSLAQKFGE